MAVGGGGVLGKGMLWVYSTDRPVSGEDIERLIELGWNQRLEHHDDAFTVEDYSLDELWACRP